MALLEQAVGSVVNQGDVGTGMTTATREPVCTSPKRREFSFGKVLLRSVILGRWLTMVLESGSEAVEQVLMQPLKYVLIRCRGGPGMPSAVYAFVAGHLQKCHLSSFCGWENSIAEWQNKDPHGHTQATS